MGNEKGRQFLSILNVILQPPNSFEKGEAVTLT